MTRILIPTTASLVLATACAQKQTPTADAGDAASVVDDDTALATITTTRVEIDPRLAKSCDLPTQKVHFDVDSTTLSGMDKTLLRNIGTCLNRAEMADEELVLVGHADPRGTSQYNRILGMSRAMSVAWYLMDHTELDGSRLTVSSAGEVRASADPAEWADDRNVRIRLADRVDTITTTETRELEVEDVASSDDDG